MSAVGDSVCDVYTQSINKTEGYLLGLKVKDKKYSSTFLLSINEH